METAGRSDCHIRATEQVFWLEQDRTDLPHSHEWLAEAERERSGQFIVPRRQQEWLLGRWTAKRAVAAFLGWDAGNFSQIEILTQPSGAPYVVLGTDEAPQISLSHRAGVAICAVARSRNPIGCDLERIEPRSREFILDYFTKEEQQLVKRHSESSDLVANLIWSAKESALKVLQQGLRLDTRAVAVARIEWRNMPLQWSRFEVRFRDKNWIGFWSYGSGFLKTTIGSEQRPMQLIC